MSEAKPRILVADDERNVRKNLALVLEAAGYQTAEARDGDEAVELCKQMHPDIAFVDLHMPKLDGLAVLAIVRGISPKTAVVIITAYGSAANATEAMKLGAVDFLEKPFEPKMIEILAKEILLRRRIASRGSFDDFMSLADLAEARNARIEARAYLKAAMSAALERPEPYYRLGLLWESDGEQNRAVQYFFMAVSADHGFAPALDALKRLGKLH
ncbi:MAG: response regulator [Chloroflexota bacterium]